MRELYIWFSWKTQRKIRMILRTWRGELLLLTCLNYCLKCLTLGCRQGIQNLCESELMTVCPVKSKSGHTRLWSEYTPCDLNSFSFSGNKLISLLGLLFLAAVRLGSKRIWVEPVTQPGTGAKLHLHSLVFHYSFLISISSLSGVIQLSS